MYIKNSYKYEISGKIEVSENLPDGATILETMNILYAEEGYILIRNSDGENMSSSVWIKDGDNQDNYHEEIEDDKSIH